MSKQIQIALLDDKTPLSPLLRAIDNVIVKQTTLDFHALRNASRFVILAELTIKGNLRSQLEGLQLLRPLRLWLQILSRITVVSFLSEERLTSNQNNARLFHLADDFVRLPATRILFGESQVGHLPIEQIENRLTRFARGRVRSELIELFGTVGHPTGLFREIEYASSADAPIAKRMELLAKLRAVEFLLSLGELTVTNEVMQLLSEVPTRMDANTLDVTILRNWVINELWKSHDIDNPGYRGSR